MNRAKVRMALDALDHLRRGLVDLHRDLDEASPTDSAAAEPSREPSRPEEPGRTTSNDPPSKRPPRGGRWVRTEWYRIPGQTRFPPVLDPLEVYLTPWDLATLAEPPASPTEEGPPDPRWRPVGPSVRSAIVDEEEMHAGIVLPPMKPILEEATGGEAIRQRPRMPPNADEPY